MFILCQIQSNLLVISFTLGVMFFLIEYDLCGLCVPLNCYSFQFLENNWSLYINSLQFEKVIFAQNLCQNKVVVHRDLKEVRSEPYNYLEEENRWRKQQVQRP